MIVYLADKTRFRDDVFTNRIEEIVLESFQAKLGKSVAESEVSSWKHSLQRMDKVLEDPEIPDNAGVAIEFNIPNTGKRIDFILTGTGQDGKRTAVIVELKQWESAEATSKDAIVRTFVGGSQREVSHPSYQAWSYAALIHDFNETVRREPIHLRPCAYLHNCKSTEVIRAPFYAEHTSQAPAFLRDDAQKLRDFIKEHVKHGDQGDTMYRIRDGKISPSKSLADHLVSLLKGNREFLLIDDQKLVYETALELARHSKTGQKNVLIVNGGPGTGKSVVAINLLVEFTRHKLVTQYVTKNSAPRAVYEAKLVGSMTKSRISNLFVGSGQFTETKRNEFDALIVDEAHRLNEKSGMFQNKGENQIKELIHTAAFSVFFLDEDQQIHWKDIGDKSEILRWARFHGAEVTELDLASQFRCNGSDGYLAWADNTLQLRETANPTLEGANYEFTVCDSAAELRELIKAKNQPNNRARVVAGYCWDWISKKSKHVYDFDLEGGKFRARWNLSDDGMLWILKPDSVDEVGCIHTCQGLELDYIGVIVGPDLIVRDGKVITDGCKRAKTDKSLNGFKGLLKKDPIAAREKADRIIKNTYRTLMTRGQKGCIFHSTDPETNTYFKNASVGAIQTLLETPAAPAIEDPQPVEDHGFPFLLLDPEEAANHANAVPIFDIKIAAGDFSKEQWLQDCQYAVLPDHFSVKPGFFLAQVVGESMNRRIPNGSWCLFCEPSDGSRNGKIVIVQSRDIQDPDTGGHYTVKIYRSEKAVEEDSWFHQRILLEPDSMDFSFKPLILAADMGNDLRVVGEFVAIIG
jgi:DUF2075 family protein